MNPLDDAHDNPSLLFHDGARCVARYLVQFPVSKEEALARLAESDEPGDVAEFIDIHGERSAATEVVRVRFERDGLGSWRLVEVWVNLAKGPSMMFDDWHADDADLAWFVERFRLTAQQAAQGRVFERLGQDGRIHHHRLNLSSPADFVVSRPDELAQVCRRASATSP